MTLCKGIWILEIVLLLQKGCGKNEQGIQVPIEPNVQEKKGGLGFHPLEIK